MFDNINKKIKQTSRTLTLKHPNSVDVLVYRKSFLRADEDNDSENNRTLGGMMMLGNEDEADYIIEAVGTAKMLFLGRILGSEYAFNGLDYGEEEIIAHIEPINENEFTIKKDDRVFWVFPNFTKEYQVIGLSSPSQMPTVPLGSFRLQPLEQSHDLPQDEAV